jgi:hypothetical protein
MQPSQYGVNIVEEKTLTRIEFMILMQSRFLGRGQGVLVKCVHMCIWQEITSSQSCLR